MQINEAITAFSQSEKIKAGLIWTSQTVEMLIGLPETEKPGAERIIKAVVQMIGHEIQLYKKGSFNELWLEVEKGIDTALVMMNSNVAHEATYHLTQALSNVTTIGQRSMAFLREKQLL